MNLNDRLAPAAFPIDAAACIGMSWLFDSTAREDHREAAALCKTCPALAACRARLAAEHSLYGTPTGTWAGILLTEKGRNPRW